MARYEVRGIACDAERIRGRHGGPGYLRGVRTAHGRVQSLPGSRGQHPPDHHALQGGQALRITRPIPPAAPFRPQTAVEGDPCRKAVSAGTSTTATFSVIATFSTP